MTLDPNFSTTTNYFFYGRLNDVQGDANLSIELDANGEPCMFLGKYIESRPIIHGSERVEIGCAVFENGSVYVYNFKHIVPISAITPRISDK
jgi:hypothetical protein